MDSVKRDPLPQDHRRLFQVCRGLIKPGKISKVNGDYMSVKDMKILSTMVEIEVLAGVKKCQASPEDQMESSSPLPFDVYIKPSLEHRMEYILCLPLKKTLVWYDGDSTILKLNELQARQKVASISGPARVLAALRESTTLKSKAMKRQGLVDVVGKESVKRLDTSLKPFLNGMNLSQQQAITTAVHSSFKTGFLAIQGPPGCGKTTTCIRMLQAMLASPQNTKPGPIIVTAPSNAAVANLALQLYMTTRTSNVIESLKRVVVFGWGCDESVHFLSPSFRREKFLKAKKLLKKVESGKRPDATLQQKIRNEFLSWLHCDINGSDDGDCWDKLPSICPFLDMTTKKGKLNFKKLLSHASVICCTLNSCGSQLLRNTIRKAPTILLDEGGQCTEAEFYIATTYPGVERIIVLGDPRQLPATVLDPQCESCGYGKSWLGEIFRIHHNKVHLLDTQYRMDEEILSFPNMMFYLNKIRSGDNVQNRSPRVKQAVSVVNTTGKSQEEKVGFSWSNRDEVTVIHNLIRQDGDIQCIVKHSKEPARMIIITPYQAQVTLLRQKISGGVKNCIIDVSTVDSFQGQEADIVILSTVRTSKPGFVDDPQRLNVALTRAKRLLRELKNRSFEARGYNMVKSQEATRKRTGFIYILT